MDPKNQNQNEGNKGSGGEKEFSVQPIKDSGCVDPKFAAIQANPGPAITQNLPAQEGSKEEREARKKALNE
ncbi:hypothetical protein E4U53_006098 [Claviceps sorghi]|nr:hypothetical protein E4U53_006098 [Claviceps sorghi]